MAVDDVAPKINKWDSQTVKNTLDDDIRKFLNNKAGWKESHSLMNGRLLISFIAVVFSLVAIVYDYLHPFPKSKIVLATCSVTYFILMGVLQLYQWYVEKSIFYKAEEALDGGKKRHWTWSSEMPAYDDKYTLTAEYSNEAGAGSASVTKSIANFINDDGEVIREKLNNEVGSLVARLVAMDKKNN